MIPKLYTAITYGGKNLRLFTKTLYMRVNSAASLTRSLTCLQLKTGQNGGTTH